MTEISLAAAATAQSSPPGKTGVGRVCRRLRRAASGPTQSLRRAASCISPSESLPGDNLSTSSNVAAASAAVASKVALRPATPPSSGEDDDFCAKTAYRSRHLDADQARH